MDQQQHTDALLEGYRGPYFMESVTNLTDSIDERPFEVSLSLIQQILTEADLHYGVSRGQYKTSDGYEWFAEIRLNNGAIVLLLPWGSFPTSEWPSKWQRSAALYVRRGNLATADQRVREITKAFNAYFETHPPRPMY